MDNVIGTVDFIYKILCIEIRLVEHLIKLWRELGTLVMSVILA